MQRLQTLDVHTEPMSDADRVLGPELKARREGLGLSVDQFARRARISTRAQSYAEGDPPRAGRSVSTKISETLARLESGEVIEEDPHVLRVELRPGIWVTVDADNVATLGDLREVEARIRRLIDGNGP
jgi:transcriptional regulator with XRE-family HTH domain